MANKVFVYSYESPSESAYDLAADNHNRNRNWSKKIYSDMLKEDIVGIQMMPNAFLYWSKDQAKLTLKPYSEPNADGEQAYDVKLKGTITDTDFSPQYQSKLFRILKFKQKFS